MERNLLFYEMAKQQRTFIASMERKIRNVELVIYAASVLVGLLSILAVFSGLNQDSYRLFFNSDSLYLPSIYKDLFIDRSGLQGWNFSPSPGFFPDMLVYFMLMYLVHDFILTSFLFGVLQYLVILGIILWLFRLLIPQKYLLFSAFSNLLMVLFFLASFFSNSFNFTYYLLTNGYHLGSFVMAFLCITMTIQYLQRPRIRLLVSLFLLAFLSIVSDRLFIVLYNIPVTGFLFFLYRREVRKYLGLVLLVNALSVYAGLAVFHKLSLSHYIHIGSPHKILDFHNVSGSLKMLLAQLWDYANDADLKSLIIAGSLLSWILMGYVFIERLLREEKTSSLTQYSLYALLFTPVVLFAPVLNGNYTGYDTIRYNYSVFILSILDIGIILAHLLRHASIDIKYLNTVAIACCLLFYSLVIPNIHAGKLGSFFYYYPARIAAIDSLAEREGLSKGVGNYWNAKFTSMFSKKDVKVFAVYNEITPYPHAANENWYYREDAVFNFIILDGLGDTANYRKILREGKLLHAIDLTIVKLSPFRFDRNSYRAYFIDKPDGKGRLIQPDR